MLLPLLALLNQIEFRSHLCLLQQWGFQGSASYLPLLSQPPAVGAGQQPQPETSGGAAELTTPRH